MLGKLSLPHKSSCTVQSKSKSKEGSTNVKSMGEWEPLPGCKYALYPSFTLQRLRLDSTSSTTLPLSVTLSLPDRGLWALKSPTIINGAGSCWFSSVTSPG